MNLLSLDRISNASLSIEWIQSALPLAPLASLLSIKSWSRLQIVEYRIMIVAKENPENKSPITNKTTLVEDMQENTKYCLNMKDANGRINMFWILLDNQSIVHIFWNVMFLVNIQDQQTVWASYQH